MTDNNKEQKENDIEITKDLLANFLEEAEKNYARYEADLGHKDENWHLWYADYILKKFEDLGH